MVSIFNFNFLLGRINIWMDEHIHIQQQQQQHIHAQIHIHIHAHIHTHQHIYLHSNSNIYIDRRINTYINIFIYKRIYRHRTCEYINHLYIYGQAERSTKALLTHRRTTTAHQFTPKYCAVDSLVNKRKFSLNSGERHDPNKYSPNSFTRQITFVFPFIYVCVDIFMGIGTMVGI